MQQTVEKLLIDRSFSKIGGMVPSNKVTTPSNTKVCNIFLYTLSRLVNNIAETMTVITMLTMNAPFSDKTGLTRKRLNTKATCPAAISITNPVYINEWMSAVVGN